MILAWVAGNSIWECSKAATATDGEASVLEIIPFEEECPDEYYLLDAVLLPNQATTRPANTVRIPVRPHFSDNSFQDFFKNRWRCYSAREADIIKSFLKVIVYDINSSHYSFPCRYHVLALREIII